MRAALSVFSVLCLVCSPCLASAADKPQPTKAQSRLTSAESYLPFPPMTTATPAGRSIGGMLTVELGLDVADTKLRTRVQAMRPRVQDTLRTALSDYSITYMRAGAPPDPARIAALAQTAIDRTLGAGGATVLLANVMLTERR
jgi:flagellar basal body-associated protein FliL